MNQKGMKHRIIRMKSCEGINVKKRDTGCENVQEAEVNVVQREMKLETVMIIMLRLLIEMMKKRRWMMMMMVVFQKCLTLFLRVVMIRYIQ